MATGPWAKDATNAPDVRILAGTLCVMTILQRRSICGPAVDIAGAADGTSGLYFVVYCVLFCVGLGWVLFCLRCKLYS